VGEFTFLSTDVSQPGSVVFFDTTDNTVKEAGANPASILGLSLGYGPASSLIQKPLPYKPNRSLVAVLKADTVVGMSSDTTPAVSHLTNTYGITKVTFGSFTFWKLDTSKTGANARVKVVGIDPDRGIFYVNFLPQYLQGQSVQS